MSEQQSERGSGFAAPRFLIIGRIRKPHGVRGELKVSVLTDVPKRFTWLETVLVARRDSDKNPREIVVKNVRSHGDDVLITLQGYESRESAGALRQHWLMVPVEDAIPLEEGEYYAYQAIGLTVSTADGTQLGKISSIIETGANDVYVVMGERGEVLLPDIPQVVQEIDIAAGTMTVQLLPGLLPES